MCAMSEKIRVVLADDHAVVRKGIRDILEAEGDIEVIADAADGAEAIAYVAEHQPDVVVLDIQMPQVSGIEATRRIRAQFPEVKVLILTAYDDDPYVFSLLQAGASSYVLKTAEVDELIRGVRAAARGESALDPVVSKRMVEALASGRLLLTESTDDVPTEREIEVLRLASRGLTNRAIGYELGISERTVQGHLANIFTKLRVETRTEAVLRAIQLGWIAMPAIGPQ